jgi:PhnB protein
MRWVNPYLSVRDTAEAAAFYRRAFGFKVRFSLEEPSGRTGHTELTYYDCTIMIGPEKPERGDASPRRLGGASVTLYVYTPDVDRLAARAEDAGAKLLQAPTDQAWGDRVCILEDPDGHRWCFATHIQDVSLEELQQRS